MVALVPAKCFTALLLRLAGFAVRPVGRASCTRGWRNHPDPFSTPLPFSGSFPLAWCLRTIGSFLPRLWFGAFVRRTPGIAHQRQTFVLVASPFPDSRNPNIAFGVTACVVFRSPFGFPYVKSRRAGTGHNKALDTKRLPTPGPPYSLHGFL